MLKIKQTWRGKIMGCLKSIIRKIIFLALLFAFFFFGGCDFVLTKYNEFTCPPREELLEQSKDFGDFSAVSSDYRLTRSLNIFGYRKFNSEYMPSGQKITIIDLNKKELITPEDFTSGKINAKINNALDVLKDSVITFENLEITGRGTIQAGTKSIPYVNFKADVKNVPFKTVEGTLGAYTSQNISRAKKNKEPESTVKVILSMRDCKKYNPQITFNYIRAMKP